MPIFNHGLPVRANVIQGESGVDTSQDTVTAETLLEGVTAHDANGNKIIGTIEDYDGTCLDGAKPIRPITSYTVCKRINKSFITRNGTPYSVVVLK